MNLSTPRIAAVRVQSQWQARTPRLRCVARLTRLLTIDELQQMGEFPEFMGAVDLVTYTCRPEEVEEWEKRLADVLELISAGSAQQRHSSERPISRFPGSRR